MAVFWIFDLKTEFIEFYFNKSMTSVGIGLYFVELTVYLVFNGNFTIYNLDNFLRSLIIYIIFIITSSIILIILLCKHKTNQIYKKDDISAENEQFLKNFQRIISREDQITLKKIGLILFLNHNAIFSFALILYSFNVELNTEIHMILMGISGFGFTPSFLIFFIIEMNLVLNLIFDFRFRKEFFQTKFGWKITYKIHIFKGFIFLIFGGTGALIGIISGVFLSDILSISIISLFVGICFLYATYEIYKKLRQKYKTKEDNMV
jgi:hypothetical protein